MDLSISGQTHKLCVVNHSSSVLIFEYVFCAQFHYTFTQMLFKAFPLDSLPLDAKLPSTSINLL